MTERAEVRFQFYSKSNTITSNGIILPYSIEKFNIGGGTYDFTNYKYSFTTGGTYFIGYSYVKILATNGFARLILERGGDTYPIEFAGGVQNTTGGSYNVATSQVILYQFQVGDIIYVKLDAGNNCRPNDFTAPTGDNINYSFWGIRLDY